MTKTISGNGAPFHGTITITVICNGVTLDPFVIPPGTAASVSQTYGPLQTPQACSVTETGDGASPPGVTVVVTGSGQTVVIPQNTDPSDSVTATIGDVYTAEPGSLSVRKVFQGAGAGQQGAVLITIDCGAAFQTTVTIPAGQTAPFERTFDRHLPAGAESARSPSRVGTRPPPGVDRRRHRAARDGGRSRRAAQVGSSSSNTFEPAPTTTTATTTTTTTTTRPDHDDDLDARQPDVGRADHHRSRARCPTPAVGRSPGSSSERSPSPASASWCWPGHGSRGWRTTDRGRLAGMSPPTWTHTGYAQKLHFGLGASPPAAGDRARGRRPAVPARHLGRPARVGRR